MTATTKNTNQRPGTKRHRALVYVRTATSDALRRGDAVTTSPAARQERQCRDWAAAHDCVIEGVHRDVRISGLRQRRPGLDRLITRLDELQATKPRDTDLIVVMTDGARLARNFRLSIELEAAIAARGATIVYSAEAEVLR
jgi:DNA invertase Pin-like site-specific DNA recombinase